MPDPGLYRFGDNVTSKEVREAVGKAVMGLPYDLFVTRGWQPGSAEEAASRQKKGMGSRGMGRESGLKLQKYIGIKVDGRCVGTLGVSFSTTPMDVVTAEDKIKAWVREPGNPSMFISFLRNTFRLWGPICP
jgi:hypothetical protein